MMRRFKLGIIGCGNMGQALLSSALKNKSFSFFICEKRLEVIKQIKERFKIYKRRIEFLDIDRLVELSDILIIAVKPQDIDIVLKNIKEKIDFYKRAPLIISIAAGITTDYLEKRLKDKIRLIRAMPNIAILVEEGMIALKRGRFAKDSDLNLAKDIFSLMGKTVEIKKEEDMDIVTALSGSGPAYVAYIIEAILKATAKLGLDKALSQKLIYQTFLGTLKLLIKNDFATQDLILKVASKKGTTERALDVFKKYQLDKIIYKAINSAFRRAREISFMFNKK